MTAAYRLKGIVWFGGCVAVVLGFYLVSLQVAAERKKLEGLDRRIDVAKREIRALETEFETRSNLAQLEKWNGETLGLAAPVAGQFVVNEGALASLDVNQVGAAPGTKVAALVVPSLSGVNLAAPAATPPPALVQVAAAMPTARPAVIKIAAIEKSAPMLAQLHEAARASAAVAKVRPQAVAMLDRKLLSDTTLGDLLSSARAEARKR